MAEVAKDIKGKVIWCGDFNSHSTLWGERNDANANGDVVLEFMAEEDLVCLNDGSGTRLHLARGTESAIDLTLSTISLADKCVWEVLRDSTIGSDHFPIKTRVGIELATEFEDMRDGWYKRQIGTSIESSVMNCCHQWTQFKTLRGYVEMLVLA